MIELIQGDCCAVLPTLPERSVQCIVTSPPYYALRDYGLPPTCWPEITYTAMAGLPPITIPGCAPDCDHVWGEPIRAPWANANPGPNGRCKNTESSRSRGSVSGESCERCGGWRGALGLEPDPLAYIAHLLHIFRLVWRVLRDDGTCWINIGDSYAAGGKGGGGSYMTERRDASWKKQSTLNGWRSPPAGLKEKNLIGIPWRLAYALQADGWYLRSDVIWSKSNPMPESVTDRCTRSHEYLFLFAKSVSYYFDQVAIADPVQRSDRPQYQRAVEIALEHGLTNEHIDAIRAAGLSDTGKNAVTQTGTGMNSERVQALAAEAKAVLKGHYREFLTVHAADSFKRTANKRSNPLVPGNNATHRNDRDDEHYSKLTRNRRTVWAIPAKPYTGAHSATFPEALVEPCVLAGSSPRACEVCGAPWERIVEKIQRPRGDSFGKKQIGPEFDHGQGGRSYTETIAVTTVGWQPACQHPNTGSGRCIVLDPFAGTFTVGRVALRYGRRAIGIELNTQYIELADDRTNGVQTHMEAYL